MWTTLLEITTAKANPQAAMAITQNKIECHTMSMT